MGEKEFETSDFYLMLNMNQHEQYKFRCKTEFSSYE